MTMGKRKNKTTRKQKRKDNNKKVKNMNKINKTTTTAHVSKASCHTGQKLIFTTHDGIEVWAGGKNRAGGWHKMSPLPELAMGPSETMGGSSSSDDGTVGVPKHWSAFSHIVKAVPKTLIKLDFPDFGIPASSVTFWYALVNDIRVNNIKSVSVQCAGGHGRTGVQLAIFRYLFGNDEVRACYDTAADLIDWVRDKHCSHAVETNSQQQYIADVCGIDVGEGKIATYASQYSYNGYYNTQYAKQKEALAKDDDDIFGDEAWSFADVEDDAPPTETHCWQCGSEYYPDDYEFDNCGSCNAPMKKPDTPTSCTACDGEFITDNKICMDCDYDMHNDAEKKKEKECMECGTKRNIGDFVDGSDVCASCEIREIDMTKFSPPTRLVPAKAQCTSCLKRKELRFIKHINVSGKAITCYPCAAGLK
jgi:protein-tyrosine phosphatase